MTASQLGVNAHAWCCNPTSVSATPEPPPYSSPLSQNRRPSVRFRQNRLSFFSWNIGQLNMSKWDLFRAWLYQQPIDCACLQDAGWQFTGEWKDQQFSYIHSGAQHHRGGLLTIVRTDFCSDNNIAWTTPMESRIQHVRLYKHTYSIDILNLYQFPFNTADTDCEMQRSAFGGPWNTRLRPSQNATAGLLGETSTQALSVKPTVLASVTLPLLRVDLKVQSTKMHTSCNGSSRTSPWLHSTPGHRIFLLRIEAPVTPRQGLILF